MPYHKTGIKNDPPLLDIPCPSCCQPCQDSKAVARRAGWQRYKIMRRIAMAWCCDLQIHRMTILCHQETIYWKKTHGNCSSGWFEAKLSSHLRHQWENTIRRLDCTNEAASKNTTKRNEDTICRQYCHHGRVIQVWHSCEMWHVRQNFCPVLQVHDVSSCNGICGI